MLGCSPSRLKTLGGETRPGRGLAGWPWGKGDCGFTIGKRGVGSPPSRAMLPMARDQVELKWGPSEAHAQHRAQGQHRRLHSRVVRALGGSATPAAAPSLAQPGPTRPSSLPPSFPWWGRAEGRRGGGRLAWQALRLGSASLPGRRGRRRGGGGCGARPPPPSAAGLFASRPTLRAAPTPPRPRAASAAPAGAGASVPGRALRSPRSPIPPPPCP